MNGSRAANELARDADVVVCVGTRLTDFTTASHSLFQNPHVRFIGINVNAADAAKLSATAVVADAREAIDALCAELGEIRRDEYQRQLVSLRDRWFADLSVGIAARAGEPMGQGEVLQTLNESVHAGDWVVAAAGYQPGDLLKLWQAPAGSFTHIEFGFSCMGHEIPAALGIRMRTGPEGEVIAVIGDGTYLMNPTELFTAAQEGLKLTVIVLDNGGYQSINHLALENSGTSAGNEFRRRGADGRLPDGDLQRMDFVANARSMGCEATWAATKAELGEAMRRARAQDRTTVIVCPTAPTRPLPASGAFWDLGIPRIATDTATQELAAAHQARSTAQRHY